MMDPSIYGVVEAVCEKHDVEEIEILRAVLLTVVYEHFMVRREDAPAGQPRRPTTLESLEACVHDQQVRNAAPWLTESSAGSNACPQLIFHFASTRPAPRFRDAEGEWSEGH